MQLIVNFATEFIRVVAQPGSVLPWGGRGRRFKSGLPDYKFTCYYTYSLQFLNTPIHPIIS